MSTKYSDIVVEQVMANARKAMGENVEKYAEKRKPKAKPEPEFIEPASAPSTAPKSAIMYSDKFEGAAAYLASSGLSDFDISGIIHRKMIGVNQIKSLSLSWTLTMYGSIA